MARPARTDAPRIEPTPATGLSTVEAARRLAAVGPNEVPPPRPTPAWQRVARQLADPLIALLIAAGVVTGVLGDVADTAVIALVIAVNTTVGLIQESRAERAVAALHQLAAPVTRVRRDGGELLIASAEVVPGDIVVLGEGDIVPADGVLIEAQRLRLDEAALTGESVPVSRGADEEVAAGTLVAAGHGVAQVVRTGPDSALGRIALLVATARPGPTPLQRRLARLGRDLGLLALGLSALVTVIGIVSGQPPVEMAITGVSLVVAAVPESLPAVVTLALALGALRMARGNAIIRRLHAVETLGSVTALAVDKTGTVTQGRMAVERAVLVDGTTLRAVGTGYDPAGSVGPADPGAGAAAVLELARAAALCNDARLAPPSPDNPQWTVIGDPVEGALLAFAARCGLDIDLELKQSPRVREEPFDASTRRMTTVHLRHGETIVICKGAPEAVLDPAVTDLPAPVRDQMMATARDLALRGSRVLALAGAQVPATTAALPPSGLRLLGLVAIADPVRPNAPAVAQALHDAGIQLIMITGDHPATAAEIARQLGIWQPGDPIQHGGDDAPAGAGPASVYARTRPEHKTDIITALQAQGQVVAMTGDGVNDAPALRQADIGVAMGGGGTQVARQAADLVLADDDIATITIAVREGRRIYDNIRRFLRYGLSGGAAEIMVMLIGPALGFPIPLLPGQILWINLLTHGLPGVALGAEPAEPATMTRPPRSPKESVLGAGLGLSAALIGTAIASSVLGAAILGRGAGAPWQSMVFLTLGLAQLGVALAVRAPRTRGRSGNPSLFLAVAASAVLQVAGVLFAPLRALLRTQPLAPTELAVCAVAAMVPALILIARPVLTRTIGALRAPTTAGPDQG